ncbi:MAG: hypothetical protein HKL80_11890, partial [Acidimicrobiales bacterium]|nr:hypothetical protein [Acidimicrobiales bacterium]
EISEKHETRLDSIDERLVRLAEISEKHETMLAELVEVIKHHDDKLAYLVGSDFENQWYRNAAAFLSRSGLRKFKIVEKSELADLLFDLIDDGSLSLDDRSDILNADSIATAVRSSDSSKIYIVVEIASRIHIDDIDRVTRRAGLLERAASIPCEKIVAGASIDAKAYELAQELNVAVITPQEWARRAA